jgi:cysteine desulfurase
VDGVQGVGKLPLVALDKIHAFVFSGHKCGAPIGIGGLLLHKKVKSTPFLLGGGQQGGYRSGTLPVPLILTLRDAVVSALSLRPELLSWPSELKRHRSTDADYSPCIHLVDVAPVDGEIILHQLAAEGILVGLGSACRAARKKPSKVHKALGLSDQQSRQTLRLSTSPDFDPVTWSKALERLLAIKTESARYYL